MTCSTLVRDAFRGGCTGGGGLDTRASCQNNYSCTSRHAQHSIPTPPRPSLFLYPPLAPLPPTIEGRASTEHSAGHVQQGQQNGRPSGPSTLGTHFRLSRRELPDEVFDGCFQWLLREETGPVLRILAGLPRAPRGTHVPACTAGRGSCLRLKPTFLML